MMIRKIINWLKTPVMLVAELRTQVEEVGAANQELQQENLRLQDRLDACLEDRSNLWGMLKIAEAEKDKAYQMHINQAWQGKTGTVPYPSAPHAQHNPIIDQESGAAGQPSRILRSSLMHRATLQFAQKLAHKQ